uniref:Uncharacterized protein n=1 Tax=Marmota marmota marmota TaxID=9994 RepID=A0A8C5ZWU1_MARMA
MRGCLWNRGQLSPKPSVCSFDELHALDRAWYTFPLLQSRGSTLWAPGRASRANGISLGTERGGTETRKSRPNWSVRKVLGRGGEGVDGGPALPAVAIVTESAPLGVGADSGVVAPTSEPMVIH